MALVITAYYFVRTDDDQWARRNIEVISNVSPAAGGEKPKTDEAAQASPSAAKVPGR
jgi:hypothetical protein